MLFRTAIQLPTDGPELTLDAGDAADATSSSTRYLTDGVNLYRFLGALAGGAVQMVGLENCRSLDVILLPITELASRRLRPVVPAAQ